ncbi:glucosamine kinase [Pectobacterium atrosepticum]|uniref:glucosamine kinase n=1 Tax=Pectobacterium atrosepticum TaxID=29471 RepID=UPI000499EE57|nr:glucosamine kinase [Pectobacterium atrosepticum]AIA72490.1 glucosamine kinase [Pectobacterium atrosepticum]AIK15470.1 glucosamine kinase [Pectobacterium atrosepticum]POW28235.1 glucosamine kinase [Pectobacterium atrosepticum]PWD56897.1 glucosamine kinase [Pectobacterium atrosepticum]
MKWQLREIDIDGDRPFDRAQEHTLCEQRWLGENRYLLVTGGFTRLLHWHDGFLTCRGGDSFPIGNPASLSRLGLWAVQEMLQAVEGITPLTPLSDALFQHFNKHVDRVIDWSKQAQATDYTTLGHVVLTHPHDALAVQLLTRCASELTLLLNSLPDSQTEIVSLSGDLAIACLPYLDSEASAS